MLPTKQQQYILDVTNKLGGVSRKQLAEHLTDVLLRQMRFGNIDLRLEGDMVTLPHIRADPRLTEAVDVMLELSGCEPLNFSAREAPPIANKHFYAVLQADGTHRFFSSDEQN